MADEQGRYCCVWRFAVSCDRVAETTAEDGARLGSETDPSWLVAPSDGERLREVGICRMMVMDVRPEPESEARHER